MEKLTKSSQRSSSPHSQSIIVAVGMLLVVAACVNSYVFLNASLKGNWVPLLLVLGLNVSAFVVSAFGWTNNMSKKQMWWLFSLTAGHLLCILTYFSLMSFLGA